MLTVNALAAADSVLIPVQAQYLPVKDLEQLLQTVNKVRRQINPKLKIDGILLTMVDARTNFAKDIFEQHIPFSVRAAEATAAGKSIYFYDPQGKVAAAYEALTEEILRGERQKNRDKSLSR